MGKFIDQIFGEKIGDTRVVPISIKITLLFSFLLLASNFTSNYLNFVLGQEDQLHLLRLLMIRDLERTLDYASTQHEIARFNEDWDAAVNSIVESSRGRLKGRKSLILAITDTGDVKMFMSNQEEQHPPPFEDSEALQKFLDNREMGGSVSFVYNANQYYGVFKYNKIWNMHFIRAEERNEFLETIRENFLNVSLLIILLTLICMIIGIYAINYIFRFIHVLTRSIISMQRQQKLQMIDMTGASNDNVTYLGITFNSLSATVENLVEIFKKFVARDIALKAYQQKKIQLEGERQDLVILFTDIRHFTYITETLGMDIIRLLNLHYGKVIDVIHRWHGDIGSIIGDALLAMFGTLEGSAADRYFFALKAAFGIHQCTSMLREEMTKRRERIILQRGRLTKMENQLYEALLLEIGVGIDGGEVFYGNIGSQDRMTNTVIGDHVNFASRLEGLTRFYKVPVICSAKIKEVVVKKHENEFFFLELDKIIVKGKTIAESIFWVMERSLVDGIMQRQCDVFSQGLEKYRAGKWKQAASLLEKSELPSAEIFLSRIANVKTPPKDWSGVWKMESK